MKKAAINAGIQLYTVRDQLQADARGTLNRLAEIGYREVELAGLPNGYSANDFSQLLTDTGLKCPVMHAQGEIASQADIAHSLGASKMVQPLALELLDKNWKPRADLTLDDFKRLADTLNVRGEESQRNGLRFGFHNHAWDMLRLEGQSTYEVLLEETDPELVFMEIDLGWAHVAKTDVVDLFERFSGRFETCHIKDFDNSDQIVDPGKGEVALAEQLTFHKLAGIQHFFVEHDNSDDPLLTAVAAYDYLDTLDYFELKN